MARILYPQLFEPVSTSPETVTADRWLQQLSQPVQTRRITAAVLAASGLVMGPVSTAPERVSVDRWLQPLSQPVLTRVQTAAVRASAGAVGPVSTSPEAVTADRWLQGLSQPLYARSGLGRAQTQTLAWSGFTPSSAVVVS